MDTNNPFSIRTTTGRRLSRLRQAEKQALQVVLPKVELSPQNKDVLQKYRERYKKVVLEIGFGRGDFLLKKANQCQDTLFIGVEVFLAGVAKLLRRMVNYDNKSNPLPENILISTNDVRVVLSEIIPEAFIDRVYILFPDPWPKKRHHKRRLLKVEFINMLTKKLKKEGDIIVATDCESYAEEIMNNFQKAGYKCIEHDIQEVFQTKYAIKARQKGHPIYSFRFVRST
ncbi:MAG: tRNA (guanosine(46)-N7)-methyltransferase TrmB [Nitrospirae bacterium]|nr:tRNA (guanosine(46)-N7)-methyltransferase TrmB [Nitrospirota bacterium]